LAAFMALLILLFVCGCSAAFFLPYVRRHARELEKGESGPDVVRLQETIDELTARLTLLEEESEFYRELRSSEDTPRIESGPEA